MMFQRALFSLLLIISLSSASLLRKSLSRRQAQEACKAIEGFDCKCSPYRLTCTSDGALPQQINVLQDAKQKYPSVELIIEGAHEQNVYDYTFEPVQQLYKPDADILEFRVKFEKFTALHLHSPGVFNRVFPPTTPSNARKNLAVEIYNPLVQPNDNENLFANLNVDSLELYVLYPFRGTFQQLFNGANIKSLRLSGGDVRSDLSQPFTGNIGRLELAKQASQLNAKNFPIYPAHELIINAFYVSDFTSDNPPNYSNLNELRIHSSENVPANAFRQYPDLKVLSLSTEKEIDPHALDGLYKLEKLTIKDTKPSVALLSSLYGLKEFETSIEKLDEREQCELIEKLANGQLAVQAIPSGRECTCASAYLETASGRYPCDASNCEQSSCPAIRNNYDATARTFKAPPTIKRADGSDALRPLEPKVYTSPYQISNEDRQKVQQSGSSSDQQQSGQGEDGQQQMQPPRTGEDTHDHQHPVSGDQSQENMNHDHARSQSNENNSYKKDKIDSDETENERTYVASDYENDYYDHVHEQIKQEAERFLPYPNNDQNGHEGETNPDEGNQSVTDNEGDNNQQEGDGNMENTASAYPNEVTEGVTDDAADVPSTTQVKKGFNWFLFFIIAGAIVGLLLVALVIFLLLRRNRSYDRAPTSESGAART